MELDRVIHGDCLDEFAKIDDNTFDMTFADPPFNLNKAYSEYKDAKGETEYYHWCQDWIYEMIRVTMPTGSIFLHNIPKWLTQFTCYMEDYAWFRHWISWDAPSGPMGNSLQPAHYGILYYTKESDTKAHELRMPHKRCRDSKSCNLLLKDYGGKKDTIHPFGPLISDVWTDIHRCKHDRYKDNHPCQLPIHLMERLVLLCTEEGGSVLDCFAGTGTSLIAAKRLGRKYLGIEQSQEYVDIAENKLEFEKTPSRLDNIWVSCYLKRIHTAREEDIYDKKSKTFRDEWKALYEDWPNTGDKRKKLNTATLKLKPKYQKLVSELCKPRKKESNGATKKNVSVDNGGECL